MRSRTRIQGSCNGLPTPQHTLSHTRRYCFGAQVKLSRGAVFNIDGECIASCVGYPGSKELHADFESRQELVDLFGNVTVYRIVLEKAAASWCSNKQSPDVDLHSKPCATSQSTTTGCNSIVNGMDYRAGVEVSVSDWPRCVGSLG